MPALQAPSQHSLRIGASVPIICGCFLLSVIVHVFTAGGISGYISAQSSADMMDDQGMTLTDMPLPEQPSKPPVELGRADSKAATITWLGVRENPVEGEAPESEVDQAELAITQGQAEQSKPAPQQQPQESQPIPTFPSEPIHEPVQEPVEEQQQPEPDPAEPEPTKPVQQQPVTPIEPTPDATEPMIEAIDLPEVESELNEAQEVQQDPVVDPVVESNIETETQQPEAMVPLVESSAPVEQGKQGEADDRESIAAKIKRAEVKKAADLNRPMSTAGLEIKPIEPRYPAAVRFTQLPSNPIMVIRFNAKGKVIFTDFLRDEDKRKIYNTGSAAVDEPLKSAIYKWRATGEPLKELDPDDPKSYYEITMKIIFRKDD